jgi:DNA replication protein DnaC
MIGSKLSSQYSQGLVKPVKNGQNDGSILAGLLKIEKQDILILDDFVIQPFDCKCRMLLLDII